MTDFETQDRLRCVERELREMRSQKSRLPTRPAIFEGGGGSAEVVGANAIVRGVVPPAEAIDLDDIQVNKPCVKFGYLAALVDPPLSSDAGTVFTTGALITSITAGGDELSQGGLPIEIEASTWEGEGSVILGFPVWRDGGPLIAHVINPSHTPFSAKEEGENEVATAGHLITITSGGEKSYYFMLPNPDLRSVPTFVLGEQVAGDETTDDPGIQIPFHPGGSKAYQQSSEKCSLPFESEEE